MWNYFQAMSNWKISSSSLTKVRTFCNSKINVVFRLLRSLPEYGMFIYMIKSSLSKKRGACSGPCISSLHSMPGAVPQGKLYQWCICMSKEALYISWIFKTPSCDHYGYWVLVLIQLIMCNELLFIIMHVLHCITFWRNISCVICSKLICMLMQRYWNKLFRIHYYVHVIYLKETFKMSYLEFMPVDFFFIFPFIDFVK